MGEQFFVITRSPLQFLSQNLSSPSSKPVNHHDQPFGFECKDITYRFLHSDIKLDKREVFVNHDHSIPCATASPFAREKLKQVFAWATKEVTKRKFLRRLQKMITQSEAMELLPTMPGYRWTSRNGDEIREWCGGWRVQKQFYTYCETLDDAIAFFLSDRV
jgi:hypothetical protein